MDMLRRLINCRVIIIIILLWPNPNNWGQTGTHSHHRRRSAKGVGVLVLEWLFHSCRKSGVFPNFVKIWSEMMQYEAI